MNLRISELESNLLVPGDVEVAEPGHRRAAVAALLRADRDGTEVLLMQRAVNDKDRWSGQVSLPGGREEEHDADLLQTAVRETREEVGRNLDRSARLLGRLPTRQAIARAKPQPMTVTPFVFAQEQEEALQINHEAREAFWFRLDRAAAGDYDSQYRYRNGEVIRVLPCWRVEERVVWGMTYYMLSELLDAWKTR